MVASIVTMIFSLSLTIATTYCDRATWPLPCLVGRRRRRSVRGSGSRMTLHLRAIVRAADDIFGVVALHSVQRGIPRRRRRGRPGRLLRYRPRCRALDGGSDPAAAA